MFTDPSSVHRELQQRFANVRVVVLGDVMLDVYWRGQVSRISPEAPVPIVLVNDEQANPGGAANVALNLACLGAQAVLIGLVGRDSGAETLKELLHRNQVDASHLVPSGRPTITKTRIMGHAQQMLRLDREDSRPASPAAEAQLVDAVKRALEGAAALVLSDYGKGVLTPNVCQAAIALAQAKKIPVLVDPKGRDYGKYRGATTVTPNLGELALVVGKANDDLPGLLEGGRRLLDDLQLQFFTFTRGEHGINLIEREQLSHIPAQAREVYDVSGAGDAVIAVMAASLARGISPHDATRLANLAGGIVVGKVGTVPVQLVELTARFEEQLGVQQQGKFSTLVNLRQRIATWQAADECVVLIHGTYDHLDPQQLHALEQARAQGDRLVVALPISGGQHPIEQRLALVAALQAVDAVTSYAEASPQACLNALRPDVLASVHAQPELIAASGARWVQLPSV